MRTLRRGVPHAEVSRRSRALRLRAVLQRRDAAPPPNPPHRSRVPGLDQVQSTTLANGMKVIVWTDRDIPNVALYNWVRVGSRNEVPGITGLAHFFEHMMFNGTAQAHAGRVRPAHGSAGRLQQRVHQRERHRLPGLDSAHGARPGVRPGSRPARESLLRPEGDRERTRRRLLGTAPLASKTTTRASWSSRCRPRRSSRIRTRFPPSAGRPTSRAGRSKTCRSSSRRTTRLTTAR